MVSFDSSKKINLIKEVRGLLNLGLKEAKELVEKAPCEIMKNIKKEDVKGIKEKLEALGAKLELE
jgi:large subunit ribosomal protein L7/L12